MVDRQSIGRHSVDEGASYQVARVRSPHFAFASDNNAADPRPPPVLLLLSAPLRLDVQPQQLRGPPARRAGRDRGRRHVQARARDRVPQGAEISVGGDAVLNFCANNYLGLSNHPAVEQAAADTLKERGFGLSSVRFICGTQDIHKQLESAISAFHGTEDTILYPSCFDANAGLFEAVLNKDDAILTDELNHASIIDGIRLCKAERHRFKHMDMADLEQKLKDTQHCRTRLIATDGVFSMDGDVAPLQEIVALAEKYDAQLFIDECHATGFFGPTGRGSDEYCGISGKVDVINSTLGKALGGSTGGYTTGRKEVVDLLRQRSRPYLFSNSLGPSVVGASLKVFEMLTESSEFVDKIRANTHHFRDRMTAAGFTLKGSRCVCS